MTLKLFILAVVFVISGGVAFSEYFKYHKFLSLLATAVAIIATFYLLQDIKEDIIKRSNSSAQTPSSPTQTPIAQDVVTTSQPMSYSPSLSTSPIVDDTAR